MSNPSTFFHPEDTAAITERRCELCKDYFLIDRNNYDPKGEQICPDCRDEEVSDCCGATPRGNGDNDTKDYGICPDCHDHCTYVKRSEL